MTNEQPAAEVPGGTRVERPVGPRAWWRPSVFQDCDPCVTVDEAEADDWRRHGHAVVELGDVAAERERLALLAESRTDGWHSLTADEIRRGAL